MLLFQYLDFLPAIPLELLVEPGINNNDYIKQPDERHKQLPAHRRATFARYSVNDQVLNWLRDNISTSLELAGLQKMTWPDDAIPGKRLIIPHTDAARHWAISYIFETGGPNVTTTFYQENGFPLVRKSDTLFKGDNLTVHEQLVIEPYRWHMIKTNVIHGVENVLTQRQAISIGLITDDPLSLIKT